MDKVTLWASKNFKKYTHQRSVLYAITALSAMFFMYLIAASQIQLSIVFVLIAFVASFFTRNMTILLGIATLTTGSIYISTTSRISWARREGLENANIKVKAKADGADDIDADDNVDDIDADDNVDPDISAGIQALKQTRDVEKAKTMLKNRQEMASAGRKAPTSTSTDESAAGVVPAETFRSSKSAPGSGGGARIDYAATLEDSYNYLDKILSSDGVSKLTADTQKLMHQQQNLFNTMTNMTGMLKNTKSMMKSLNVDGLSSLAESMTGGSKAPASASLSKAKR